MLKLRLQGKKYDLNWFCDWLGHQPEIEVIQSSDVFSNKGTNQYYRMYVEIRKVEKLED
ncbi:MAG: hypothetical protein Q4F05_08515 [bacterium]|nr:hypothetical protein [bacterium]